MTAADPTDPLPDDPAPDPHALAGLAYRLAADKTARRAAVSALVGAATAPAQLDAALRHRPPAPTSPRAARRRHRDVDRPRAPRRRRPPRTLTMPQWTPAELRHVARRLALVYLAVERGHTPLKNLQPYLTSNAMLLQRHPRITRTTGPPPRQRDVVAVHAAREPGTGRVHATALTRDPDDQCRALLMRFQIHDGKLRTTELVRAEDREALIGEPRHRPAREDLRRTYLAATALEQLVTTVRNDAARAARGRQPALFGPHNGAHDALARWDRLVGELRRDADDLAARLRAHDRVAAITAATPILGDRPDQPAAAAEWDTAITAAADYRARYHVSDDTLYGPAPADRGDPVRAAARDAIRSRIDAARDRIGTLTAAPDQERTRDEAADRDL